MAISNPEYSQTSLLKPVELNINEHAHKKGSVAALVMAAIGVVFGDIGTSPLYALKECFSPEHGIPFSQAAVFGIISMMFWAILLVVTFKYVLFVMRADNKGEGGVLSLMALALRSLTTGSASYLTVMMLGMFGACMLYGESVITPAISVLSAVEGLEIATPELKRFVIPITLTTLIALFVIQKYGTAQGITNGANGALNQPAAAVAVDQGYPNFGSLTDPAIDYSLGIITLKALEITGLDLTSSPIFELIIKPQSNDVVSIRNQLVTIPDNNINVNLVIDKLSLGDPAGGANYIFTSSRN